MEQLVGKPFCIFLFIYRNLYNVSKFTDYPTMSIEIVINKFHRVNRKVLLEYLMYIEDLGLIETSSTLIALTSKGRTYPKVRLAFWITNIIQSVFFPIVVAFITTLITLWWKQIL